jgi:microcystin-dependent protein
MAPTGRRLRTNSFSAMSQSSTTTASQPATARRSWLKRLAAALGGAALAQPALARPTSPTQVQASESYLGEIILVPYNFAPRNYALCNGQLLSISQNQALFSLLGTLYGGDGRTTFALPNLQGSTAIGMGQGAGLTNYPIGSAIGTTTATLATANLPAHTHSVPASSNAATQSSPAGAIAAVPTGTNVNGEPVAMLAYAGSGASSLGTEAPDTIAAVGSNQAIDTSPYLVLNYCIALNGYYPSRA